MNFPFMTKSEKRHDLNDGNKKNRITDTGTFPVPEAPNWRDKNISRPNIGGKSLILVSHPLQ